MDLFLCARGIRNSFPARFRHRANQGTLQGLSKANHSPLVVPVVQKLAGAALKFYIK